MTFGIVFSLIGIFEIGEYLLDVGLGWKLQGVFAYDGGKFNLVMSRIDDTMIDTMVDAAVARPINAGDVKNDILGIGAISSSTPGELGMAVKKSGRTTGFTTGEILQVDVTVNVQYGAGQTALFSDQLLAGAMSQGGDSGSAVLDNDNRLVGLLFAGSDQTTIINRIENVFSELGISL